MANKIHPTAVIDPKAELDDGVLVGPLAVVGADVRIGAGTRIDAGARLEGPTTLGENNRVYSSACLGFDPQDLKYQGEPTRLEVGSGNHFREFCTVNRGTVQGGGVTSIGDDNLFMAYTHIAHDCHVGSRTIFGNCGTLAGHVEVQDDSVVNAFSSVQQFCRIGRFAYIGGYSVITRDALPYVKTVGTKPACYGVNRIGLERKGFPTETLKTLERAYRIVVRGRHPVPKALELLRELGDMPEVAVLAKFLETSERGVIRDMPGRGNRGGGGG